MRDGHNGVLVSVDEATELFGAPRGTLYRWAHEDGWTPFGGRRSRHWRLDDVQGSYDRRRART